METLDAWVLDQVVDECGPDAPDTLVSAAERFAGALKLSGTDRDREILRQALRLADRALRIDAQVRARAAPRGRRQRQEAVAADLVRWARANKEVRLFRTAYGLPLELKDKGWQARSVAIAQAWGALPKPALEALGNLEGRLATHTEWTRVEARHFVLGDVAPESLPTFVSGSPLVAMLQATSLDDLRRHTFATKRRKRGEGWQAISVAWDRRQPPEDRYGDLWKQFQRDVGRTSRKLRHRAVIDEAVEVMFGIVRAVEREAEASVAATLDAPQLVDLMSRPPVVVNGDLGATPDIGEAPPMAAEAGFGRAVETAEPPAPTPTPASAPVLGRAGARSRPAAALKQPGRPRTRA